MQVDYWCNFKICTHKARPGVHPTLQDGKSSDQMKHSLVQNEAPMTSDMERFSCSATTMKYGCLATTLEHISPSSTSPSPSRRLRS